MSHFWSELLCSPLSDTSPAIGVNFFKLCGSVRRSHPQLGALIESVRAVLRGTSQGITTEYSCLIGGTERWFSCHVLPLMGPAGRQVQLLNLDVTDLKAAVKEQQEALEQARCIMWHSTVEQTEQGLAWNMRLASDEAAYRFLPVAHLPGQSYEEAWNESVAPEARQRMDETSRHALLSGESGYSQEYESRTEDGQIRTISEQVRIEPIGPGRWKLVGVCTDITDRVRAEREIQEREALYHALIETIPQLVWTCDAHGIVDYFNRRWYEYTGIEPSPSPHELWLQTIHPADMPAALDAWTAAVAQRQSYDVEMRMRGAAGTYRWFLVRGMPLKSNDGQVIRWFGTCTDIDDSKRAERTRQFISEIGHLVQAEFATEGAIERMVGRLKEFLAISHCDFVTVDYDNYVYSIPRPPYGEPETAGGTYPLDLFGTEIIEILQSGNCFVSDDLSRDPRVAASYPGIFQRLNIQAVMLAPVIKAGAWMAVLSATQLGTPRPWQPEEIELMRHIADQAWLALENSRLDRAAQTELLARMRAVAAAQTAQAKLADVLESMTNGFLVLDKDWRYSYVNRSAEQMIGMPREEMLGKSLWELYPQIATGPLGEMYRRSMTTGTPSHCELFDDVYERWLGINLYPWHGGLAVYYQDVTDQRRAEADRRESELRFRQLAENIDAVFWLREGSNVLYVSPAYEQIWGRSVAELHADQDAWINAIVPEDRAEVLARYQDTSREYSVIYRIIRADGAVRWIRDRGFPVSTDTCTDSRIAGLAQDITEVVEAQERVRWQAYHDGLTGLPNRQMFAEHLESAVEEADRNSDQLAVLFLDVDNFKHVNDSLGRDLGDLSLREIALRIQQVVSDQCTVARIGGDEFAVLLPRLAHPSEHLSLAARIVDGLAAPIPAASGQIRVTASVGISIYPTDARDTLSLMKYADMTMAQVKERGKNAYEVYTPSLSAAALERIVLSDDIHMAIERKELELFYQPQVDTEARRIVGAEALLRWRHPALGMIPPLRFISIAEETGAIGPIGEWVLRQACRQAAAWRVAGYDIRVAVNVSAHQLKRPGFAALVQSALDAAGLESEGLEIELTESALMDTATYSTDALVQLRSHGVAISVDDFGTGYSSLSYVSQLPIDTLKIDRSFVIGITDNPRDAAVIKSVINLAAALALNVIAEGVETVEQREMLLSYGCRTIQGYLVAKPMPADAFTRMLAAPEVI